VGGKGKRIRAGGMKLDSREIEGIDRIPGQPDLSLAAVARPRKPRPSSPPEARLAMGGFIVRDELKEAI
jgi:hypothetical protein